MCLPNDNICTVPVDDVIDWDSAELVAPGGAGRLKSNQLETITTFTYEPSLVRIDAHNFELSW